MPSKNYTITELQHLEGLSVRTVNVCERYGLTDLESILAYYSTHENFLNLKNAGRKTDLELTLLCRIYGNDDNLDGRQIQAKEKAFAYPPLEPLSKLQRTALNDATRQKFTTLSPRAQNCLTTLFKDELTFEVIYKEFIENKAFIEIDLQNSGAKTNKELLEYITKLLTFHTDILQFDENTLWLKSFTGRLNWIFKVTEEEFEPFKQAFLGKRFPLFKFINFLINNEKLFSKKRNSLIFRYRTGYFKGTGIEPLDKLGEMLGLSRERVRQIAEKVIDKFDERLSALESQSSLLKDITSYEWKYDADLIFTSNQYADKLNKSEAIDFEPALFTKIISFVIKDSHGFFSGTKKPSLSDCCISNELTKAFDFRAFWDDVFNQISGDIAQEYSLNFEGYLIGFMKSRAFDSFPRISSVCREILVRDFPEQLSFDFGGNIVFHRNTYVKVAEYAVQVLDNEKRPMHIKEIHEKMLKIYPDYKGDHDTLRAHLNRDNDTFIYFGRNSTYGLSEWEGQIKGIKGGTIRSITEEFLEQFDEPKHIAEIAAYVLKFRPKTNERSIFSNLQLEQNGKFTLYNGVFWGLSDKNYSPEKTQFNNMPASINRLIFKYLRKSGGASFNHLIRYFCHSLQLKEVQVDYQLRKLLEEGKLWLSEAGEVTLPKH